MKALTKGQYEGIASVLARGMDATAYMFAGGLAHKAVTDVIETLAHGFADQFEESDPEFKRELFLELCGIKTEKPYCDHTFGQFECGEPVQKWGMKCPKHSGVTE